MGKGKKTLSARERKLKEERRQKNRKARIVAKWKRAGVITTIAVLILAVLVGIYALTRTVIQNTGIVLRNRVAMSSDNFEVDAAMLSYYFYETYQNEVAAQTNVLYTGIDSARSLKEQDYTSMITWFDFFMDKTTARVSDILLYAEGAKAANTILEDADKKSVDDKLASLAQKAKEKDVSLNTYIASVYGRGVKQKDIRRAMELEILSDKHYQTLDTVHEYTDEELETYYEENAHLIKYAAYKAYTIYDSGITDEENKALAEELAATKSPEEFDTWLATYIPTLYTEANMPSEENIAKMIADTMVKEYSFQSGTALDTFLFETAKNENETTVVTENGRNTVYMVVTLPQREEYNSVNVRHILIDFINYPDENVAKETAENVFALCQNGMKEEEFIELVTIYSEDESASADDSNGLLENLTKHSLNTTAQGITDWCYEEHRVGDVGMVKTENYGYHILYYGGKGEIAWKVTAKTMMDNEAYDTMKNIRSNYESKYPIEIREKVCDIVPDRVVLL